MGRVVSYNDAVPRCTFCGKSENQVRKLVTGSGAAICDECIELCVDIISEERDKDAQLNILQLPKPHRSAPTSQSRHRPGVRQKDTFSGGVQPLQARQHGNARVVANRQGTDAWT